MLELGTAAPDFRLPDAWGNEVGLTDFPEAKGTLVAFICNHCPFVKHIAPAMAQFGNEYTKRGLAVIAINSNDTENYPDDAPEKMIEEIENLGYEFPYLVDASQETAKAYRAACTPDFFLFDRDHKLVYRGQFDASRPESEIPVTGEDLRAAADAVLAGEAPSEDQRPSLGCNIKWKAENAPGYA